MVYRVPWHPEKEPGLPPRWPLVIGAVFCVSFGAGVHRAFFDTASRSSICISELDGIGESEAWFRKRGASAFQNLNRSLDGTHLVAGNDPGGLEVAQRVYRALEQGDDTLRGTPNFQLAVTVAKGSYEKLEPLVVVLVRIDTLNDESRTEREILLQKIAAVAFEDLDDDTRLIIGVRDGASYGAIGQMEGRKGKLEIREGSALDVTPLQDAAGMMAGLL